jgi:hypothetical protein
MVSERQTDRNKVLDMPKSFLFSILMMSSYANFNIFMLRQPPCNISLLPGAGCTSGAEKPTSDALAGWVFTQELCRWAGMPGGNILVDFGAL